jgi:serine/threonine protein kinase
MARVVERDQTVIQHVYVGMGSVAYLAPEAFNAPGELDHRSDLYALGITFYEIIARKLPGRRSPMPTKLHPTLPKVIDDLFDRLTQDEPADRYQSVDEALEEFYKSDQAKTFLEPRGTILFVENPLSKLVMKSAAKEEEPPPAEEAPKDTGIGLDRDGVVLTEMESDEEDGSTKDTKDGPVAFVPSAGDPDATAVVTGEDEEVSGPGLDDEDGDKPRRRSAAHRPYSFQQRIKDRDK